MRITYFNKCEMTFKLYKQCIKMKTEKKNQPCRNIQMPKYKIYTIDGSIFFLMRYIYGYSSRAESIV